MECFCLNCEFMVLMGMNSLCTWNNLHCILNLQILFEFNLKRGLNKPTRTLKSHWIWLASNGCRRIISPCEAPPRHLCSIFSSHLSSSRALCLDVWMAVIENPGDKLARGETGNKVTRHMWYDDIWRYITLRISMQGQHHISKGMWDMGMAFGLSQKAKWNFCSMLLSTSYKNDDGFLFMMVAG